MSSSAQSTNTNSEDPHTLATTNTDNEQGPATPSPKLDSGYSSCDEGPRSKKPKTQGTADASSSSSAPLPSTSPTNHQTETADVDDPLREDSDIKPDTDFNFDEQLFDNMFASSDTLTQTHEPGSPRPIVIDGSNIAFSHGKNKHFSEQGILICVDYFQQRGHDVKVFVSRVQHGEFTRKIAKDLEDRQILIFTPSRRIGYNGKRVTAYDDRFILQYATVKKAIVVSNDNYRDLYEEEEKYHEVIRERLLGFTWAEENVLMFPNDPMGRNGARLDEFLKFPGNKEKTTDVASTPKNEDQGGKGQSAESGVDSSGYESDFESGGEESDPESDGEL